MLVYVRDSVAEEVLKPVRVEDVPKDLVLRYVWAPMAGDSLRWFQRFLTRNE